MKELSEEVTVFPAADLSAWLAEVADGRSSNERAFLALRATPMSKRDAGFLLENRELAKKIDPEEAAGVRALNLIRLKLGIGKFQPVVAGHDLYQIGAASNLFAHGATHSVWPVRLAACIYPANGDRYTAPGRTQAGAGYALYGPSTMLVITDGTSVDFP